MPIRTKSIRTKTNPYRLAACLLISGLVMGLAVFCLPEPTTAQQSVTPATPQGRRVTLRDQLVSGLRAFTAADVAFIDSVVLAVNQGRLPRRVVDGTFFWARDRAARRGRYRRLRPIVFFQPALKAQARQFGVIL